MASPSTPNPEKLSRETWVGRLKDGVLRADVEDSAALALFNHLTDLGMFEKSGKNEFVFSPGKGGSYPDQFCKEVKENLAALSRSEKGFALGYFLSESPLGAPPQNPGTLSPARPSAAIQSVSSAGRVSDLSNLQIVRKIGRQLQPFLELEEKFFSTVVGPNTTREDAQQLYDYVLAKTRKKIEPLKWVQLSRRRHK